MANTRGPRGQPTASRSRSSMPAAEAASVPSPAGDAAERLPEARVVELVDPSNVPETFANEAAFVDAANGIVTTTYVVYRVVGQTGSNTVRKKIVVGRIAMPIASIYGLRRQLDRILTAYEAMKAPPPDGKAN